MGNGCTPDKSNHNQVYIDAIVDKPQHMRLSKQPHSSKMISLTSVTADKQFVEMSSPKGRHIRWKLGDKLGEGAYAAVYQCMNLDTGKLYAVKHFKLSEDPQKVLRDFRSLKREVSLLSSLKHPNIVQYYQTDISEDLDAIDVVLEFVPGGSLKSIIQKYGHFEGPVIRNYARQLLLGLEYLHINGVIHRDLKCANVLVTPDGVLKLSDFGSSKKFENCSLTQTKSMTGSPYWMAPEIVLRQGHSLSADIWSLGCVVIEMMTGKPPWSEISQSSTKVLSLIGTPGNLPAIPECPPDICDFIRRCLQRDPAARPISSALLEHPMVDNLEADLVEDCSVKDSVFLQSRTEAGSQELTFKHRRERM
jgi:serine/threonine protein kinase